MIDISSAINQIRFNLAKCMKVTLGQSNGSTACSFLPLFQKKCNCHIQIVSFSCSFYNFLLKM